MKERWILMAGDLAGFDDLYSRISRNSISAVSLDLLMTALRSVASAETPALPARTDVATDGHGGATPNCHIRHDSSGTTAFACLLILSEKSDFAF